MISARQIIMSVLCLMGSKATATVPDGIWTMPEPQGLEFTTFTADGEHYILYNPVAKMFFSSGNDWNVTTSLRTFGMEVWMQDATEADAPTGSYELWDLNVNNPECSTGQGNIFTDDGNRSWVDHGTQANYSWSYEIVGDCVRLANVAFIADHANFVGTYLGWDGTYVTVDNTAYSADHRNAYTAILKHVDPNAAGASVDWKAVTVESYEAFAASDAYEAYAEGIKIYIASVELKKAIENAEALGLDVTDALAVYTNMNSTVEDMEWAIASLRNVEIDGIYYNLIFDNKVAEIKSNPNKYIGNVVIPENVSFNGNTYSVTSIEDNAFSGCSGLTSITIPNSVTTIGRGAFSGCSGLISISINCEIVEDWFNNITSLKTIIFGDDLKSIGDRAFYGCSNLTSISIPNSVTSIGEEAFGSCHGLTNVTIPNSVTNIGSGAF